MKTAKQLLEFNTHHYFESDFDEQVRHTIDLPFQDVVEVCIDLHQMGVGADNSWGNPLHDQYKLLDKEYRYGFIILPVAGNRQDIINEAVRLFKQLQFFQLRCKL